MNTGLIDSVQTPVPTPVPGQATPVTPALDQPATMPTQAPPPQSLKGQGFQTDQEEVDMFLANGMKLIHSPQSSDSLIQTIKAASDPVRGLADAGLQVIDRLEKSANTSGKSFSLATIAQGGNALMGEIAQIAEIAGVKLDDEAKYRAYSFAVSKYIDNSLKSGKMSQDQLRGYASEAAGTEEGKKILKAAEGYSKKRG